MRPERDRSLLNSPRVAYALSALLALGAVLTGCSSVQQLSVAELPPEGVGAARVVLRDGYSYGFDRVTARHDSLIGFYRIVEERVRGDAEIAYIDVERSTVLDAEQVAHVEISRFDWSKSLLVGAGAVLTSIWLIDLFDIGGGEEDDNGKDTGGISS